ncbi:hypothetical protein BEP19_00505 [Ammoniphilus oxalaticus]|uniref:Uncharacterized protein n=1 Tax=Ammoniphilus oxalaticus TaxID=66863 RepID=A0A419SRI4_9BACL|nr:hypothetical protein [Ammoniphilus oxalaticus]RKD27087.1 hypothetical protein BEP19_00505 [Ammoniphilus oxalaticus]
MNSVGFIISSILVYSSFKWEVGFEYSWIAFLVPSIIQLSFVKLRQSPKGKEYLVFGIINLVLAIIIGLIVIFILGLASIV